MEDEYILQMKIRCLCGKVSTVLDGETVTCKCGRSLWFVYDGYGNSDTIRPYVSTEWRPENMIYNRPLNVEMKWVKISK